MLHCNEIKDKIMFLNSENTKLIEYLKLKNMYRYADAYLQFLGTGGKLDKTNMKILLKNIRSNDFSEFENKGFTITAAGEIKPDIRIGEDDVSLFLEYPLFPCNPRFLTLFDKSQEDTSTLYPCYIPHHRLLLD